MIVEYHRPDTIDEALTLLGRQDRKTVPLGGGTVLNAPSEEQLAVVDLQNLGLNAIKKKGGKLTIGAAASLQDLLNQDALPEALAVAIRHEAAYNLRQTATVAGTLVAADGRSAFAMAMLALDAQLLWLPGEEKQALGEFMPLREEGRAGRLISEISISTQPKLAYEYVARSPADLPIVGVAAAGWPSGRTRIVLGGYGKAPLTVMDGQEQEGALPVVENAFLTADDEWASAEYRVDAAKTLTKRCLELIA